MQKVVVYTVTYGKNILLAGRKDEIENKKATETKAGKKCEHVDLKYIKLPK